MIRPSSSLYAWATFPSSILENLSSLRILPFTNSGVTGVSRNLSMTLTFVQSLAASYSASFLMLQPALSASPAFSHFAKAPRSGVTWSSRLRKSSSFLFFTKSEMLSAPLQTLSV